jgi:purine-binding chemotaxis protein CheW
VPNAPGFIIGVTNLRGKICPVMDMRRRFELPAARKTGDSRIVVLEIDGEDVGMLVDAVAEVLRLRQRSIEPPPLSDALRDGNDVVEGIANLNGRLIVVFNVHRILSADSDNSVSAVAA